MKTDQKYTIIAALLLGFGFFNSHAAAQEKAWEWTKPISSNATNAGYSIVTDAIGNSFVAGSFMDTLHIAGKHLVSKGYYDIFIAAFSPRGELLWLKQAGGADADEAYGATLDNAGNVYITGYFSGTVDFSGMMINSYRTRDFFVAKYDPQGNFLWVRCGKVSKGDYANSVSTDDAGNVFISGVFHGTMYFGNSVFTSDNHKNLFIVKFNTDGDMKWFKVGGGDEKDEIHAIHADNEGDLYVTGSFEKQMIFDKMLIESSGRKDIFLAKYNSDGEIQWLRKGGSSTGDDMSSAIELDAAGNIYLAGSFSGNAYFGKVRLKSSGSEDIFLVKYNSKGDVLWAKQTGGMGNEHARALIMDGAGDVYLAGEVNFSYTFARNNIESGGDYNIFVMRFFENGDMTGNNQITGSGFKKATSLGIDKAGNVYLLGYFLQQVIVGDTQLSSNGAVGSGFIAKMRYFTRR
jgi:hypothetical protein